MIDKLLRLLLTQSAPQAHVQQPALKYSRFFTRLTEVLNLFRNDDPSNCCHCRYDYAQDSILMITSTKVSLPPRDQSVDNLSR